MEFVKLRSSYFRDAAIQRAGEAAEVLFTRALAHCGDQETDGLVTREILPYLTPTRGLSRAASLVREGLWEIVPEGWRFVTWDKHQVTKADLEHNRAANRTRQARHRARRTSNGVRNAVTNAEVTATEVEEEVDNAAAAALHEPPRPLPPAVDILRSRLNARKLTVRWDKLTADQLADIERLVQLHGDDRLIRAALNDYRPGDPPRFAQAWLATWQAMPTPTERLALVDPPCTRPGHQGTTRHCSQCASEDKAAEK